VIIIDKIAIYLCIDNAYGIKQTRSKAICSCSLLKSTLKKYSLSFIVTFKNYMLYSIVYCNYLFLNLTFKSTIICILYIFHS
jgi:hypothetical protein